MTYHQVHSVTLLANSSGAQTTYTADVINSNLLAVVFAKGTLATAVKIVVTGDKSGVSIFDKTSIASGTYYPRGAAHSTALAAMVFESTDPVPVLIPLANEKIKIVVSAGGNGGAGTLKFITG